MQLSNWRNTQRSMIPAPLQCPSKWLCVKSVCGCRFGRPPLHPLTASAAFLASLFPISLEERCSTERPWEPSRNNTAAAVLSCNVLRNIRISPGFVVDWKKLAVLVFLFLHQKGKTTATRHSYKLLHACTFQTHQRIIAGGAKTKRPPHSHANRALCFDVSTIHKISPSKTVWSLCAYMMRTFNDITQQFISCKAFVLGCHES